MAQFQFLSGVNFGHLHVDAVRADSIRNLARAGATAPSLEAGPLAVTPDRVQIAAAARSAADASALTAAGISARRGVAMLQAAQADIGRIDTRLTRLKELADQAAAVNAGLSNRDLGMMEGEFQRLLAEIDAIAASSQFNGTNLLSGDGGGPLSLGFQVGTGVDASDGVTVSIAAASASDLNASLPTASVASQAAATSATTVVEAAQSTLNGIAGAVSGGLQALSSAAAQNAEAADTHRTSSIDRASPEIRVDFARLLAEQVAEEGGVHLTDNAQALLASELRRLQLPDPPVRPAVERVQQRPVAQPPTPAPEPRPTRPEPAAREIEPAAQSSMSDD